MGSGPPLLVLPRNCPRDPWQRPGSVGRCPPPWIFEVRRAVFPIFGCRGLTSDRCTTLESVEGQTCWKQVGWLKTYWWVRFGAMGKGIPAKAKRGFNRVPFKACEGNQRKRLTSWKHKQRTWTLAGLRALRAPLVGRRPIVLLSGKPNQSDGLLFKTVVSPASLGRLSLLWYP